MASFNTETDGQVADVLGDDEMAVCPFVEDDLEALIAEVPSGMLSWLAHAVDCEAVRRGL